MIVDAKAGFNRTGQVIGWDRGRLARSEREARNGLRDNNLQNLRAFGELRARRPQSQQITCSVPDNKI